jgi:polyhydroxyalkanoate synthase
MPPATSTWIRSPTLRAGNDKYLDPEVYLAHAHAKAGSWWPEWQAWLAHRSGRPRQPPGMGAPDKGLVPLGDAPGGYALMH